MFALLDDKEGIAHQILTRLGVDSNALQRDAEEEIEKFPKVLGATPAGQIYISQRLKNAIEGALKRQNI